MFWWCWQTPVWGGIFEEKPNYFWSARASVCRRKQTKSIEQSPNFCHACEISIGTPSTTWRPSILKLTSRQALKWPSKQVFDNTTKVFSLKYFWKNVPARRPTSVLSTIWWSSWWVYDTALTCRHFWNKALEQWKVVFEKSFYLVRNSIVDKFCLGFKLKQRFQVKM